MRREDFGAFFAELHAGATPFAWQRRLLDHVASSSRWPEVIGAPTGCGKTSVIDVHVFVNALDAAGEMRVPRRMSLVVNRRALVDDHRDHADRLRLALESAEPGTVVARVAELLRGLRVRGPLDDDPDASPLIVTTLRGGDEPDRRWRDDPTACAVLCATPDMWGSRLLLRGYGTRPYARPVEAGLLGHDDVLVVDEAHLNRQLITTARRVAELTATRPTLGAVPVLQVVETTATPASSVSAMGVQPDDVAHDEVLHRRLHAVKSLSLLPVDPVLLAGVGRPNKRLVDTYVEACWVLRDQLAGGTIGCLVNTVGLAVAVASRLQASAHTGGRGSSVVECLVGPMRPYDMAQLRVRRPGLFTLDGNDQVQFLVSTQTLEVGVDLDLRGLVTGLAPGSALAQRFGRVNRIGRADDGAPVVVVVPDSANPVGDGPYDPADLLAAREWLNQLVIAGGGVSPAAVSACPAPVEKSRRTLLQRPESADAEWWARTSGDLITEPGEDVSLWLRDDLAVLPEVSIAVRAEIPLDVARAVAVLTATPPQADELYPTTLAELAKVITATWEYRGFERLPLLPPLLIVHSDAEVSAVTSEHPALRPGDVLIVSSEQPFLDHGVVRADGVDCGGDVYDAVFGAEGPHRLVVPAARTEDSESISQGRKQVRECLAELVESHRQTREGRAQLAAALRGSVSVFAREPGRVLAAAALLERPLFAVDVVVVGDPSDPSCMVCVIIRPTKRRPGAEMAQVWSTSALVTLADHQRDVGELARAQAERLGLALELIEVLQQAGTRHDAGKADPRFQRALGSEAANNEPLRAKSGAVSPLERRQALAGSGLPFRWRHEQLSAAMVWAEPIDHQHRSLLVRLVGTTHGRGLGSFEHGSTDLLPARASDGSGSKPGDDPVAVAAAHLFDDGGWEQLVECTQQTHGVWGAAFLEAVLRTADTRISAEGR